jgi:hypothetical protein
MEKTNAYVWSLPRLTGVGMETVSVIAVAGNRDSAETLIRIQVGEGAKEFLGEEPLVVPYGGTAILSGD